ncbi:coiled-coil-helix-coiled-coil-helix domain containing 6, isoform CRA_a, partial [Mus musculus]
TRPGNWRTERPSSAAVTPSTRSSRGASRKRPRRVEPVCSGLQAQILRCYRDHLHEVLLCSDLVKAYQHCVSTARKG